MKTSNKTVFYAVLVAGILVITVAAWLLGKSFAGMVSGKNGKNNANTSATVEITDENKADEQSRADRIRLDTTDKNTRGEEDSDSDRDKDRDKDTRSKNDDSSSEKNVDSSEDTNTSGQSGEKVIITTDDDNTADSGQAADSGNAESGQKPAENMVFRLQLGKFVSRENAQKLADEVKASTGLDVYVAPEKAGDQTLYRVQGGAFSKKENAESYARELELKGYKVYVASEKK